MALVNEAYARERGGKFLVRFDDSHPLYLAEMGRERLDRVVGEQHDDLEWLGLKPDAYVRQIDIIEEVRAWTRENTKTPLFYYKHPAPIPWVVGEGFTLPFPLAPELTMEKVVIDNWEQVTHLIRGMDLLTEYSLYQFHCLCFDMPQPKHIYLPRLKWQPGDMSKTFGAILISELRSRGYSPKEVRDLLAKSCLIHPPTGWVIENIKPEPRIVL